MTGPDAQDWHALVACEDVRAALDAPRRRQADRTATGPSASDSTVVVVDCRFSLADPAAGEAAWRAAHVPGAHYAHLDRDLSGPHRPGAGRHPWPDPARFAATVARWGIGPGTRVALYDDGDGAMAARLWCLLRASGHGAVAVMDGGWARWCALGLPQDATRPADAPPPPPHAPVRRWRDEPLDADAVQAHLEAGRLLLDARAPARFRGETEPLDRVAGHVPGAVNRAYTDNLDGGRFKPAAVLRAEFVRLLGDRRPDEAVVMCGSGVTACHHLLAMAHAGLDGARLYVGSWSGWIEDPARPVATGAT